MKKAEDIFCGNCFANDDIDEEHVHCRYYPDGPLRLKGQWCVVGRQFTIQELSRREAEDRMRQALLEKRSEILAILCVPTLNDEMRQSFQREIERIDKALDEDGHYPWHQDGAVTLLPQ